MGINNMLNIGRNGVNAYRAATEVASQNVANASVDGYSRRRGDLHSLGLGYGRHVAAGVRMDEPQRIIDGLSAAATREALGEAAYHNTRETSLATIETIAAPESGGLRERLDDFFTAFSDLSAEPAGGAQRDAVFVAAENLAGDFHAVREQLGKVATPLKERISNMVQNINELSQKLADVNRQILSSETGVLEASDLRDERDRILDRLAEIGNASAIEHNDGSVSVSLPNGAGLVSGIHAAEMGSEEVGGTTRLTITTPGTNLTKPLSDKAIGGELSAELKVLNEDIGNAIDALDEIAFGVIEATNGLHTTGVGLDGVTGRNFFTPLGGAAGAARDIAISADVAGNTDAIAATTDPNALPSGSNLAVQLADLRDASNANLGGRTITGALTDMQGAIGSELARTKSRLAVAESQAETFSRIRESTRGVNLDEELTDILKFQRGFEAVSRVVNVADELMQTVLSLGS